MRTVRIIVAIVVGIFTIGLVSSLLAYIQMLLFPSSKDLFHADIYTMTEIVQLVIKFIYVTATIYMGNWVSNKISRAGIVTIVLNLMVSGIVGWLWFSAKSPWPFWLSLNLVPVLLLYRTRVS